MHRLNISRLSVLLMFVAALQFQSCRQSPVDNTIKEGKKLASVYCNSCHLMPDPSLLDKKTWAAKVLPAMAGGLGISTWSGSYYKRQGRPTGISISIEEWNDILAYYSNTASSQLKIPTPPFPLQHDWACFKLHLPPANKSGLAATTMVSIDTISHTIFTADAITSCLNQWNTDLLPVSRLKTTSPVVNMLFEKNYGSGAEKESVIITKIGSLSPSNRANGALQRIGVGSSNLSACQDLSSGLRRPVQTVSADFNKDGLTDYVVCGFGHKTGGLELLTQQKNGQFIKSTVRTSPGAEQAITGDFNKDGWPDIMVLFAQADEGIWMFLNDQHGGFTTRKIMAFPPVYGSSSFQLVDFNGDGQADILYTCGDNADYSPILKPYHGIYIYTNTGNFNFSQTWFYPVNGCTKAIAADFRHTGLPDIASIAFFADIKKKPDESFIYFRQDKPMNFSAHAIPVSRYGRWLCMTVGDYDQDGDLDIILGSLNMPSLMADSGLQANPRHDIPFIILENQLFTKQP